MNPDVFGVYVHIPFCVKKCNYCDFLSYASDDDTKKKYITALINEIKSLDPDNRPVASVFIGGGTPSCIDEGLIADVMSALHNKFRFAEDAEVTIECNPETLTREKARVYIDSGINRISFGLQSTDNATLKLLGRIHTYEKFIESFNCAREAGFNNINVDMMAALPGQTLDSYMEGLAKVVSLNPEHISAYSLIVEEGTQLYDNLSHYPDLPDEDVEREMYHRTFDYLERMGYRRYEISNYAKQGFESRHNSSYWEMTDYIGTGLGASGYYKGYRYTNTTDMEEYIRCATRGTQGQAVDGTVGETSGGILGHASEGNRVQVSEETKARASDKILPRACEIHRETTNDMMEEFMFLGLRKMDGVSYDEFQKIFGCDIKNIYAKEIEVNCHNGLLCEYVNENGGVSLRLTERGIDISNTVMADFIK